MTIAPATDDRCTYVLRAKGAPYPRTCAVCGLGPCYYPSAINIAEIKPNIHGRAERASATAEDVGLIARLDAIVLVMRQHGVGSRDVSDAIGRLSSLFAEVERLRGCLDKDPNTILIAHKDGDHERLTRAAMKASDRAEKAEADLAAVKAERDEAIAREAEAQAGWQQVRAVYFELLETCGCKDGGELQDKAQGFAAAEARAEAMRKELEKIADHGNGYTTGEGHQACKQTAIAALENLP